MKTMSTEEIKSKLELSERQQYLKEAYTLAKPCCVVGNPDARTVWLKVGNQSFCLDLYQDNEEEAEWMRAMLAKALDNLCTLEGH